MFNVGDLVIGNEDNEYGITNRRNLCIVGYVDDFNHDDINVFVLEESNGIRTREISNIESFNFSCSDTGKGYFAVQAHYFRPITMEEWNTFKEKREVKGACYAKNINYDVLLDYFKVGSRTTVPEESIEPAINLKGTYNFTKEQEEYVLSTMSELLTKYHHANSEKGLKAIWETYKRNKAPIASILSNHPNWDEKVMGIVLESSYSRAKDSQTVKDVCHWFRTQIKKWVMKPEYEYKINCCTYAEIYDAKTRLSRIVDYMRGLREVNTNYGEHPHHITFDGMTYEEVVKEYERICELYNLAGTHAHYIGCLNHKDFFVNDDMYMKYMSGIAFIEMVASYEGYIADEDFAEKANEYAKPFNFEKNGKIIGLKAVKGQKISRIVGKFMKYYELDKIVDKRTETWTSENGERHTRIKDYGWNGKIAEFGDAINPLDVKRWTIISVNPIDYLTMSFGNSWASCQTIDKLNERNTDSEHNYSGMYCSGTLSYMLDGATVIMYTVDEKYKGKEFCLEDKMNRCNFHIGEDKFIQGRVYPDGRDSDGETSIASQLRTIMQKVLAECVNETNLWKLFKGTNNCDRYAISADGATNYKDWTHYKDCTVSLLKREGYVENREPVIIGHAPICTYCGDRHSRDDYLACYDCASKINNDDDSCVECANCGSLINIDDGDYIYDEDTERYYCDAECAENDGCYYCDNVSEWHSENVYFDDYTENYFYDCWGTGVHFTDRQGIEFNYYDNENAYNDGWIEINDEWYREDDDEVIVCPHCGAYTLADREVCLECGATIEDEEDEDELDETA